MSGDRRLRTRYQLTLFALFFASVALGAIKSCDETRDDELSSSRRESRERRRVPNRSNEADYMIERTPYGVAQLCNHQLLKSPLPSSDLSNILLSEGVFKFGTSASRSDYDAIRHISALHYASKICGPVAEIGVYKGWFVAVLVAHRVSSEEHVFAFDLFGDQSRNVDNSGGAVVHAPQIKYFWSIVNQTGLSEHVSTVQSNSLDLDSTQFLNVLRYSPRFVSIDGAHFRIATFHDLNMISRILHPAGVIALDDYNNDAWSGVKVAYGTFLAIWPELLHPFLATNSKLYLCFKPKHKMFVSEAEKWFQNSKRCSAKQLALSTDTRVHLDPEVLLDFVDATVSKDSNDRLFC